MKHLTEFRDLQRARGMLAALRNLDLPHTRIMEICGGQTHAVMRFGLDQLLPANLELLHGPGCPVCVTDTAYIDAAIAYATESRVILCTFADMLRVPGTHTDLMTTKAKGARVELVYSPADALAVAAANPKHEVVLFAVGFETTAPAVAWTMIAARQQRLTNFSLLSSHVRVPPAIRALLSDPQNQIDGFLAAGHVCTIMGLSEYEPLVAEFQKPIVVTGFEPVDLLTGIWQCAEQIKAKSPRLTNPYGRCVKPEGNPAARAAIERVFMPVDRHWRGLGMIPASGFGLSDEWRDCDATHRLGWPTSHATENTVCRAGDVLCGRLSPSDCPAFGKACTPQSPLGAPMVSNEGACAAHYRYRPEERHGIH